MDNNRNNYNVNNGYYGNYNGNNYNGNNFNRNNYNNCFDDNNRKNNGGFGKGLFLGVFCSAIIFCIVAWFTGVLERKNTGATDISDSMWSLFGDNGSTGTEFELTEDEIKKIQLIQAYIEKYAYYEQDREKIIDSICGALLSGLDDKYSAYYNEEAYSSLMESSSGEYYGIGCVVQKDEATGYVLVIQPYKDSPSYKAGLAVGDIITKIDDIDLADMDLDEAVSYIRGEEGSTVELTYYRDGEEHTVTVERRKIEIPTVEYEMLEDNIGYIQITQFDTVTVGQFEDALNNLIDSGAKGLIFDVRSNPGGMYDSVVDMLDMLLPEGTLVYTEDKYGNRDVEESDAECINIPMAVLINENSASASEIFAGAMKDFDAAKIIGVTSYGKGIVQSIIPLGDGTGIKFTVSSYFTPSGVCIHGIGIEPDEKVELPKDKDAYDESGYLKEGYDTQLNAAIEYLKNEQ